MKLILKAGTTNQRIRVFLQDSSSTTGAALTGLAYNTANLKMSYARDDQSTVTTVTLADATVGAFTSGGFKQVDAANFPGLYEVGVPNAALTSGKSVQIQVWGATNLLPCLVEIELTAVDHQSATAFMTSVPTVVDKADYALSTSQHTAVQADAAAALTAQGYTTTRAGYLDNIDDLDALADAFLDRADGVEPGETLRQALRIMRAVLAGNATGNGTSFKRKDGTTTAISVDHDSSGNRSNSTAGTV